MGLSQSGGPQQWTHFSVQGTWCPALGREGGVLAVKSVDCPVLLWEPLLGETQRWAGAREGPCLGPAGPPATVTGDKALPWRQFVSLATPGLQWRFSVLCIAQLWDGGVLHCVSLGASCFWSLSWPRRLLQEACRMLPALRTLLGLSPCLPCARMGSPCPAQCLACAHLHLGEAVASCSSAFGHICPRCSVRCQKPSVTSKPSFGS